jgi:hypothetical protein
MRYSRSVLLAAGRQPHLAQLDDVATGRAAQRGVGGEAVLRLGHAHGQLAVAGVLQGLHLALHGGRGADVGGAIGAGGHGAQLLPQRQVVAIGKAQRRRLFAQAHHLVRQRRRTGAAFGPVARAVHGHTDGADALAQQRVLGLGVGLEVVDRHHHRQPEDLEQVVQVALDVGQAAAEGVEVLAAQVDQLHAAVELERAHRGHHHRAGRAQAGDAALDVDELLRTQVGAETGFGDDVVGQPQRRARGQHRVAAVRDVGEGPAVQQREVVLERLHEVGRQRVLQQHGHGAVHLEIGRRHRLAAARFSHDDARQALLQIGHRRGQAQDGHHLGGHDDVEAVFAHETVARAAQAHRDVAQRAVVHVHHALERDAPRVDVECVAVMDVVVEGGRQQVVGGGHGVEVAVEVQVDVLHRHHLRTAATSGAALEAEHRP